MQMDQEQESITLGFGGGCHWCTEAVFSCLTGVHKVKQGFIASEPPYNSFSEAVLVIFNPQVISVNELTAIHVHTHSATSEHSRRDKYRSAIYYTADPEKRKILKALASSQYDFENKLITKVLPLSEFKASAPEYRNYYFANRQKPFCERYITPKLDKLKVDFSENINEKFIAKFN